MKNLPVVSWSPPGDSPWCLPLLSCMMFWFLLFGFHGLAEVLWCNNNYISSLFFHGLSEVLWCNNNYISSLCFHGLSEVLWCNNNYISSLCFHGLAEVLWCNNNYISSLCFHGLSEVLCGATITILTYHFCKLMNAEILLLLNLYSTSCLIWSKLQWFCVGVVEEWPAGHSMDHFIASYHEQMAHTIQHRWYSRKFDYFTTRN